MKGVLILIWIPDPVLVIKNCKLNHTKREIEQGFQNLITSLKGYPDPGGNINADPDQKESMFIFAFWS